MTWKWKLVLDAFGLPQDMCSSLVAFGQGPAQKHAGRGASSPSAACPAALGRPSRLELRALDSVGRGASQAELTKGGFEAPSRGGPQGKTAEGQSRKPHPAIWRCFLGAIIERISDVIFPGVER